MSDDAQRQLRFLGVSFYVMLVLALALLGYLVFQIRHDMRVAKLFEAIQTRNVPVMERLLSAGLSPDEVENQFAEFTALMRAAQGGHVEVVRVLLNHGAKVDLPYKPHDAYQGRTALMWGVEGPNRFAGEVEEVIDLLIRHGANVNATDASGQTALTLALDENSALSSFLLNHGANPNSTNDLGQPALIMALESSATATARILIEKGADINAREQSYKKLSRAVGNRTIDLKPGRTPLMAATEKNLPEMVELLLQKGARVNDRDKSGITAMRLATNGHPKVIRLLKAAGAEE